MLVGDLELPAFDPELRGDRFHTALQDLRGRDHAVVMGCAFTANREVPGPDGFDIRADRGGAKPLTFGAGIHSCLGANLARAELGEALALLARRFERVGLDGEPELGTIAGIYGVDRLPVWLT